ncbi:hypothetical protein P885DRAFT_74834 [Corynascus similis CBS 632.67]
MRGLAAQLSLPAPAFYARLRPTVTVPHSGIARTHVSSKRLTSSWCRRPPGRLRNELPSSQKHRVSRAAPFSQNASLAYPSKTNPARTGSPPLDEDGRLDTSVFQKMPFRFDTGIALFAKRTPRPFPPPFLSPPSGSFSDPLSTHDRSRDRRRAYVDGHLIQGFTNGDDAVFASDYFICANDGVGAWSTRPRGHAGLWARLMLHFWAAAIFEDAADKGASYCPDPVSYLQRAYEQTIEATSPPNDWQGTTTTAGAQLHYRRLTAPTSSTDDNSGDDSGPSARADKEGSEDLEPLLYVTNLGDSQIMVIRPSTRELVYKSAEQWHWFDCPRQLGTNSPDTPRECAVVDEVPLREGDVVLAMSDGVIDNLWAHEIVERVSTSLETWRAGEGPRPHASTRRRIKIRSRREEGNEESKGKEEEVWGEEEDDSGMGFVADELMEAARTIAVDPFAESPFMEHAVEEGLASVGGKLDDISVVAAICKRNDLR